MRLGSETGHIVASATQVSLNLEGPSPEGKKSMYYVKEDPGNREGECHTGQDWEATLTCSSSRQVEHPWLPSHQHYLVGRSFVSVFGKVRCHMAIGCFNSHPRCFLHLYSLTAIQGIWHIYYNTSGRVWDTFELNQPKSGPSQLLPVFSGFHRLQNLLLFIWTGQ